MQADNEFSTVLSHLYEKNLILHDTALFDPVLYFYYRRCHCPYRLYLRVIRVQLHVPEKRHERRIPALADR